MILPTKHIRPERALISIGADALACLAEPKTVSRLWDEMRVRSLEGKQLAAIHYDWFVLALDLLFMVGAIDFRKGLITRLSK